MKKSLLVMVFVMLSFWNQTGSSVAEKVDPALSAHQKTLKGPYANGMAVTKDCLKCHRKQADEVLQSAHWLWQGPSPDVVGQEYRTDLGKRILSNNF